MDSRGAPEWVRGGHASDQSLDLGMDRRATSGRAARELRPVLAEAAPLPPKDGVRGYDDDGLSPSGPDCGQPDPSYEGAERLFSCIRRAAGARPGSPGRAAMAAEEEGEEPT
jgi:hypothetical protein